MSYQQYLEQKEILRVFHVSGLLSHAQWINALEQLEALYRKYRNARMVLAA